jgi:hypothetical protein
VQSGWARCVHHYSSLSHPPTLRCLKDKGKGADGFSKRCPYSTVVPVMSKSIELAVAFTRLANGAVKNLQELALNKEEL